MLPQLKTHVYASQAFWLVIAFTILFLYIKYVIWPKIHSLHTSRHHCLQDLLVRAQELHQQTTALQIEDALALKEAQEMGKRIIQQTQERIAHTHKNLLAELEETYEKKLSDLRDAFSSHDMLSFEEKKHLLDSLTTALEKKYFSSAKDTV